jgi:hypothetical protein
MSTKPASKPTGKMTLKKNKKIGKPWDPESRLVFEGSLVIGRMDETDEFVSLDETAVSECDNRGFKYDQSLLKTVDEEEEAEAEPEEEADAEQDDEADAEPEAEPEPEPVVVAPPVKETKSTKQAREQTPVQSVKSDASKSTSCPALSDLSTEQNSAVSTLVFLLKSGNSETLTLKEEVQVLKAANEQLNTKLLSLQERLDKMRKMFDA